MIVFTVTSLLLFNCEQAVHKTPALDNSQKVIINSDSSLMTGWYYILDKKIGFKRQLDRETTCYYLDPTPIVTAKNIADFEIYTTKTGEVGLKMALDEKGAQSWADATGKYLGRRLAFIVDNKLLHVPLVNAQITFGLTALNRSIYSREDLEAIAKTIEREKK